jgi:hypothetical protein
MTGDEAVTAEKRVVLPFKYKKGVCDKSDPAHMAATTDSGTPVPPRHCSYCTSAVQIGHNAMCQACATKYAVCAVCGLHLTAPDIKP